MKEIVNCAAYSQGRRIADVALNDVHEVLKANNQFVWIGLHEPSEEVLSKVQQINNAHAPVIFINTDLSNYNIMVSRKIVTLI